MTSKRPATTTERPLDAPLLTFDLPDLLARLKSEETWQKGEKNAITLLKGQGLRVVLVAMHSDVTMQGHKADSPISLQVIEGCIKFNTNDESVTLKEGQVLSLQAGIHHVDWVPQPSYGAY